jgi:hypothetical protein
MLKAMKRADTVIARFGGLTRRGWGVLLPASRYYRRLLGLSDGEQLVIDQLLYHYRWPNEWRSFSQKGLADELGVGRSTFNEQLKRLRQLGLVATRADSHFGTRTPPLFYCLEPYLAVLAMREGFDHSDQALWAEGNDRLLRFAEAVEWGTWKWDVDDLDTFRRAHNVTNAPTTSAASLSVFLAEEPSNSGTPLSVPPTQEDSDLHTTRAKGQKTSVDKESNAYVVRKGLEASERVFLQEGSSAETPSR